MMIEQIQIHFPRYAPSVICNILQRDAECAARWQVEKHLPRLPCSDGLPDGGCVDGAAILVAPSTLPLARSACGGTQRGRWFSGCAPTAHNAAALLDASQQHIMQLSCWMRSNSLQCCSWVAGCAQLLQCCSWVAIVPSALQWCPTRCNVRQLAGSNSIWCVFR